MKKVNLLYKQALFIKLLSPVVGDRTIFRPVKKREY